MSWEKLPTFFLRTNSCRRTLKGPPHTMACHKQAVQDPLPGVGCYSCRGCCAAIPWWALLAFCQSPKTKAQCDVTGCTEIYHQKDVLNVMCLWRRPFCCNHSKPPPKRWLKTRKNIIILPLFIEIIWAFLQPDFFLKIFTSLTFFP